MDALFLELLNRSLAASWLVLAVLILRPLTKKAPKNLRCLLWGLAALRLLLPARLKSPWSLIPAAAPITVAPGATSPWRFTPWICVPARGSGPNGPSRTKTPLRWSCGSMTTAR